MQSNSSLFEIIAASHIEMWHSAFVKWILDPNSSLGLGTFPLRRFLYMVKYDGIFYEEDLLSGLDLSIIEDSDLLKLDEMVFQTEYKLEDKSRLDIIGNNEIIRISIENKIKSKESTDQTTKYYKFLQQTTEDFTYDMMVFLTPDERQEPQSSKFIQINYQQICDQF